MNMASDNVSLNLAKYNSLKFVFKNGNSKNFSKKAQNVLESIPNPLEFFCSNARNENELFQTKLNCFPSQFLLELENYTANHKQAVEKLLTSTLQLCAFEILRELKISALQTAIVNSFSLYSAQNVILPLLKEELHRPNKLLFVCSMAVILNFQSEFSIYEIVIPLFLQDKISDIEKFLNESKELQIKFLEILDGLVGNKILLSDLLQSCKAREVKGQKSPKVLFKLGMRLMKKYSINTETCPNILQRHKLSSLRYLFMKHYIQNELSHDSLMLFSDEICEDSLYLSLQALDLFLEYNDCASAVSFLKNKDIPHQNIPHQIKAACKDKKDFKKMKPSQPLGFDNSKSSVFYSLSLPSRSIYEVRTVSDFENALCDLLSYSVLGIDTEWKPTFQFDKEEKLMLIQIAVHDKVYLLDMLYLCNLLTSEHWDKLGNFFSDSKFTKLTYAFSGDLKCLKEYDSVFVEHTNKMCNVIDLNETKKTLVDSYPEFFLYLNPEASDSSHKGLSEMVYFCFGKPLDKREQCSYWSRRPLSQNQISYAALDAFCLIDIYHYLGARSKELNILDWKTLSPKASQASKSSKTVNKNSTGTNSKGKNDQRGQFPQKPVQKISASTFKVVCDSMLQGLGKLLRSCNIDTIILGSSDYHEKCIEHYEQESRVILTRGNIYHRLRKYIPSSHLLLIKSDVVKSQLEEVTTQFGVVIKDKDIFARCCECNGNSFLFVDPKIITETKSTNRRDAPPFWMTVDGGRGRIDVHRGVTNKGVRVQLDDVPYGVLNRVKGVYVCEMCGKCYWDGSHMEKVLHNLNHIICRSVPSPRTPK